MTDASLCITLPDEQATQRFAARLAAVTRSGDCFALTGDLGAGKTSFARGFIQSLCGAQEVTSPTFTIAQSYLADDGRTLWHFDLYRLRSAEELEETGLGEALEQGPVLIEWPDIARAMLPAATLDVAIAIGDTAAQRVLRLSGSHSVWGARLDAIERE
jgi:tRNA threonylcarbamoyl adenosine modification protein YjeE